jgi:hypothetical protein
MKQRSELWNNARNNEITLGIMKQRSELWNNDINIDIT